MRNGNNKAFFLETSGRPTLTYRQACAIESLARLNPNTSVHLLMTSRDIDYDSPVIKTLIANFPSNFDVTSIDVGDYITDTPLEHWYFCTTWNYGPYPVVHLSDALRLLTLFKFGGYYFDLDVIHIRPLGSLRNFFVAEDHEIVGNDVLHADQGHVLIELALEEFHSNYRFVIKGYLYSHELFLVNKS
jgi:lactosylceramide 4-alpha-galactosyltransferase